MSLVPRLNVGLLGIAIVALAAAVWVPSGSADPATPTCADFSSQGDAQALFAELHGSPRHPVGDLDGDRDGIACEGLPAPYAGYATLGYNRKGGFFYGLASMPAAAKGEERFPCLEGNRGGPEGPRRLRVYRVRVGDDRPVLAGVGAEAQRDSGQLVWKAPRATIAPGRYYVAFAEAIPLTPYGRSECPSFRSRDVTLPAPRLRR